MRDYSARVIILLSSLLLMISFHVCSQTLGCNFKPGTIQLNLSGQSTGASIVSRILLVDASNVIRYKSMINSGKVESVGAGSYKAIAITWDNNQTQLPSLEIGENLTTVEHCWKSTSVDLSVCDCNVSSNSITVPLSVGSSSQYILTDGRGVIQQVQSGTTFSNLAAGIYNHYVLCSTDVKAEIGSKITGIPSTDFCRITPLSYVVCLADCPPVICVPIMIVKIR